MFTFGYVVIGVNVFFVIVGSTDTSLSNFGKCISSSSNWFFWSYLLLFILSPALNAFVEFNSEKSCRYSLIGFFTYQSLCSWILSLVSDFKIGFSAVSFCGLYLTAQYLRRYSPSITRLSVKQHLMAICFWQFCILFCRLYEVPILGVRIGWYVSPFVIMMAIHVLLIFSKIKFQSRWINFLAGSSFTVYLFHTHSLIFYNFYKSSIRDAFNNYDGVYALGLIVLIITITYALGVAIDQPRKFLWKLIQKYIPVL